MADFEELDDFHEHEIEAQGRKVQIYRNGDFTNAKILFVQHHWSWDDFLCAASQRLEMIPTAKRVFNANGVEIDDVMVIEENDLLFFSVGGSFQIPTTSSNSSPSIDELGGDTNVSNDNNYNTIVGGYVIQNVLGRGGFGEVRLGVHQLTREKVALKFILKTEMSSLGDAERTNIEIQCLTALNHPNIMKLIRALNEPNHVVLVLELLEGGDLYHYLRNRNTDVGLPEEEALVLFTQILSAVSYAHNQHICHRDLKLENIVLANKDDISVIKVADFGLSDFYKPGAMIKTSCGSISYLAPEVFRGTCNAGPPLDIWSLGVILFAILTNRLPFENMNIGGTGRPKESIIRQHILNGQYETPDNISEEAIDLLKKMLHLDPNERATISDIFIHPWMRGKNSLPEVTVTKDEEDEEEEIINKEEPSAQNTQRSVDSFESTEAIEDETTTNTTVKRRSIKDDPTKSAKQLHPLLVRQASSFCPTAGSLSTFSKHNNTTTTTAASTHSPTRHRQIKDNAITSIPKTTVKRDTESHDSLVKITPKPDISLPRTLSHIVTSSTSSPSKQSTTTQNLMMPSLAKMNTGVQIHENPIPIKHKGVNVSQQGKEEILPKPRKSSIESSIERLNVDDKNGG